MNFIQTMDPSKQTRENWQKHCANYQLKTNTVYSSEHKRKALAQNKTIFT